MDGIAQAVRDAGLQTIAVSLLFSFLNDSTNAASAPCCVRRCRASPCSVLRRAAGNPRVRARQHHFGLRLCRSAAGRLSGPAAAGHSSRWGCRICMSWAPAAASSTSPRRCACRPRRWNPAPPAGVIAAALAGRQLGGRRDLVRHGRHHGESQRDRRRRNRGHGGIRGRRRGNTQALDERHRPSDPRPGDRSGRGQRGRRQHRLGRPRRRAKRRATQRRRRSWSGRDTVRGGTLPTVTDADVVLGGWTVRRCSAALCRSTSAAAERAIVRGRAAFGSDGAGGGRAHRRGGEQQHGAGAADRLGGTWP